MAKFWWTECAAGECARAWGAGECLLAIALATSRLHWVAARSPSPTIGGSREIFQSRQISDREMPGLSFQLMLFVIWLQKPGSEKLEMISKNQPSAGPKKSQKSTCQFTAEARAQLQCG